MHPEPCTPDPTADMDAAWRSGSWRERIYGALTSDPCGARESLSVPPSLEYCNSLLTFRYLVLHPPTLLCFRLRYSPILIHYTLLTPPPFLLLPSPPPSHPPPLFLRCSPPVVGHQHAVLR